MKPTKNVDETVLRTVNTFLYSRKSSIVRDFVKKKFTTRGKVTKKVRAVIQLPGTRYTRLFCNIGRKNGIVKKSEVKTNGMIRVRRM